MTDRELLELAAKAAGYDAEWFEDPYGDCFVIGNSAWLPLTNDGDALRLAVKLHVNLNFESYCVQAQTKHNGKEIKIDEFVSKSFPIENANRRAIVRAAAEIGKEMV
jgi:uncharacterized protein (DUF1684 family)